MPRADYWEDLAAFMGRAYLRYSFTKGTEQEVGFLCEAMDLRPGQLVLDAGCGPGRHSRELAARGMTVVGLDLASRFLELAAEATDARFVRADVTVPPFRPGRFDLVLCFCQGGFGLLGGGAEEQAALSALAGLVRPGGRLALTAFSAYYAFRWRQEAAGETFDLGSGVHREQAIVKSEAGAEERTFELVTTCFTPRELRMMAAAAGLVVDALWSVEPGRWARRDPEADLPELLLLARRPEGSPVIG